MGYKGIGGMGSRGWGMRLGESCERKNKESGNKVEEDVENVGV